MSKIPVPATIWYYNPIFPQYICIFNRLIPNMKIQTCSIFNYQPNKQKIMGSSHHGKKYFISLGTNRDTNWPSILNTRSSSLLQIDSTVSGGRKTCLKLHKRTLKHKWTLCWEMFFVKWLFLRSRISGGFKTRALVQHSHAHEDTATQTHERKKVFGKSTETVSIDSVSLFKTKKHKKKQQQKKTRRNIEGIWSCTNTQGSKI